MTRPILLARPHPFIVNEMRPLLTQAGFDVKGIINDTELANINAAIFSAAVISLAVISPVSQDPQQVLVSLKAQGFTGKIIFAGLVPFERVENNLKQFLAASGWNIDVHALSSRDARSSSAAYIQQSDLAPAQAIASRDFLSAWV